MRNVVNFNDLFKRINVLEEATYKSIAKKELTPLINAYVGPEGETLTAKSRLKNLIMIRAMYNLDFISDAESAQLNRKSTSSSKIIKFLVEKDPDFFNGDKGKKLEEYIKANSAEMVGFHIENDSRGTFTKQEVQKIEDIGVEEIGDAISQDISNEIDLYGDYFDERYIVEIQVANPNDAVKVKDKLEPYADRTGDKFDDGVQIVSDPGLGSLVSFTFGSNSENAKAKVLADKVGEIGLEAFETLLAKDIKKVTDKFQIILYPPDNVNIQEPTVAANKPTQDRTSFKAETPAVDQNPDPFDPSDENEGEEGKAKKDYDGDGKVETPEEEYRGSRRKAIRKAREEKKAEDEETVTESYTAQYLTEQPTTKSKDKQLSTIQESVSFKNKMKPKTSWQLEELRRYGL